MSTGNSFLSKSTKKKKTNKQTKQKKKEKKKKIMTKKTGGWEALKKGKKKVPIKHLLDLI